MSLYGPLDPNFDSAIAALNIKRIANYQTPQEYPANWGGLVAAILDLNWGQASTGPQPPTWIQNDEDYNVLPSEGALWFDTRQGRLFCYANDGWYQTNGGDGYATVRETEPPIPIDGQFWLNDITKELEIYDGEVFLPVESALYLKKTILEGVLNASADYNEFKTNLLALL